MTPALVLEAGDHDVELLAGVHAHRARSRASPERFYNLKIGIAWTDTQNRMDRETGAGLLR